MVNTNKPVSGRLYSLDALRGFDMFWITGGEGIFIGLASLTGWPGLKWRTAQPDYVPRYGFVFYYMIFSLFLFRAGISLRFFFGGIAALLPDTWAPLIDGIRLTDVAWVFLFILFKKKYS